MLCAFFDLGSESSSKASKNYQLAEMGHTTRAEKMKIYIFIFVFLSCLPSALSPISYAILHFPQPQNWELPLVMEYLPCFHLQMNFFYKFP